VRTFCEHFPCDWIHQSDTVGVCVLLESEPTLDPPHGPNALVMRRSGVQIPEAALIVLSPTLIVDSLGPPVTEGGCTGPQIVGAVKVRQ